MRELQRKIIETLQVTPNMRPNIEVERRISFLCDYLVSSGSAGFVLGISGGQDSSLAGKLCQLAVERTRSSGIAAKFIAVRLPYRVQVDEDDAQLALSFIAPDEHLVFNIAAGVDGIGQEYAKAVGSSLSDFGKGNVKARARMIAQYAIASERGMLVVGTDHAAEAVTGFYTKFGDGGADVLPLSGLNKRQGRAILEYLAAPERLYLKPPTADLLDTDPGQTDETNLGLTYQDIDDYLEGKHIAISAAERIEELFMRTRHKRATPVVPYDKWWR